MQRLPLLVVFFLVVALGGCGDDKSAGTETAKTDAEADGHEHGDDVGKNHGVLASFSGGDIKGQLELKLHDDKGDLELWLMDADGKPFDLPIDAVIGVAFESGKNVELRVRNKDQNEDEAENANNRDGMTNYFIFPGDTGGDASWLMGKAFKDQVTVSFSRKTTTFKSDKFELTPHVH